MDEAAVDPSTDPRANYDYRDDTIDRPALVDDLESRVEGDVRFDRYSRELYATDASAYAVTPIGVVFPRSRADVVAVVDYCARREIPVLPRGGGTSLAGQSVNEAVVLDFTRYMDNVIQIEPDARRVRAQPGIYLGTLNEHLAPHGLKFAPDPAWGDKSALGGAIGNNSTGSHSLVYGKTDAYLESCEVVLADGTVTTFGEVDLDELRDRADAEGDLEARIYAEVARIVDEEADEVEARYPALKRNVSGYNLDRLIDEASSGSLNLARLLAGSEGTLAIVTEAEVGLEPVPETSALCLLCYGSFADAMADVGAVLDHGPAALEAMDDVFLELAGDTEEFGALVGQLPDGTESALLVEFYADSTEAGRAAVADLLADRVDGDASDEPARADNAVEAYSAADQADLWKMRKSGLPILLSRTGDEKHLAFIEDCAIPPEHLPGYVERFEAILDDHGTFASFYGHAGPGVLHVRPLVNAKTLDGVDRMESIADAVTDLVVELDGSVSGEHGDGRARTQWNRKLYGDRLWEAFRRLKTAFDPGWILNPGHVCGDVAMTEHLRFAPDGAFDAGFEPELEWPNERGFAGMAELCHGCGGCRGPQSTTGGVMCPTFRASQEEITSTRGRANLLRRAMTGELAGDEALSVEFMHEVLDLCIGCKGCKRDCPSGVDLAKLKAEVANAHHHRHGASLRDRLFADVDRLAHLGSAVAPLANRLHRVPGSRRLLEATLGITRDRALPTFRRETFVDWHDARGAVNAPTDPTRRALVVPDTFTNYVHPGAGRAAVEVLEAAGVEVALARSVTDTGRPALSKGFIDDARSRARRTVETLGPFVREGWDVVVIEPSDAVMVQSDYADLFDEAGPDDLGAVMGSTYGVCEYLDVHGLVDGLGSGAAGEPLTYHGHCHQKAHQTDGHAVDVLEAAGYTVDRLDSGCCGMAGSSGYEAEHASMSRAIARILFRQVEESPGERVVAPGASCRAQLGERFGEPPHPIELVAEALSAG